MDWPGLAWLGVEWSAPVDDEKRTRIKRFRGKRGMAPDINLIGAALWGVEPRRVVANESN